MLLGRSYCRVQYGDNEITGVPVCEAAERRIKTKQSRDVFLRVRVRCNERAKLNPPAPASLLLFSPILCPCFTVSFSPLVQ